MSDMSPDYEHPWGIFDTGTGSWVLNCFDYPHRFENKANAEAYQKLCPAYKTPRYVVRPYESFLKGYEWDPKAVPPDSTTSIRGCWVPKERKKEPKKKKKST